MLHQSLGVSLLTNNKGFSLIESIVFIVILAIALTGIISLVISLTRNSVQPVIISQASSIASSYMEEILSKAFSEATQAACPAPPATRLDFDDMCYYNNIFDHAPITDPIGNTFPTLEGYAVTVAFVFPATLENLTPITAPSGVIQVNVTVHHTEIPDLLLTAYRTLY